MGVKKGMAADQEHLTEAGGQEDGQRAQRGGITLTTDRTIQI